MTLRGNYGARDIAAASPSPSQILADITVGRARPFTPQARVVDLSAAPTAQ